jgi:hypothetical protein
MEMKFMNHFKNGKILLYIILGCVLIFIPKTFFSQVYDIIHHRYVIERDLSLIINPEFDFELGEPWYFTRDTSFYSPFIHGFTLPNPWEPSNYVEALNAFETDTVTLLSDTTTIKFSFGFNFIDIDSLLDTDSLLNVQYQILDVDSQIITNVALETKILNPEYLRDSSGQFYSSYSIQGYRLHTFASYPGQRVVTRLTVNWPAIKDSIEFFYGLVAVLYSSLYYGNFETNLLPYTIGNIVSRISEDIDLPSSIKLYQNYPNPFNESTNLEFYLNKPSSISIVIYDILGRKIFTLAEGLFKSGPHKLILTTQNLSSGVYFYYFKAGNFSEMKKFVVIK